MNDEKTKTHQNNPQKSSDFKHLKLDNEHVCVCMCVCLCAKDSIDDEPTMA
jgi:hypothetical protein